MPDGEKKVTNKNVSGRLSLISRMIGKAMSNSPREAQWNQHTCFSFTSGKAINRFFLPSTQSFAFTLKIAATRIANVYKRIPKV